MAKSRIFGTPSEPLFNNSFGLSPELLEDCLHVLAENNENNMEIAYEKQDYFKNGKSAEYIFFLCDALNLPIQVKYLAVEIYGRFMSKHICSLYEFVQSSSTKHKQNDWNEVKTRINIQIPLRQMSCVQLASKLASHFKALTANKVRRYLSSMNHHFTNNSILKSELRILKTLDHCLPMYTPLTYIETILEILGFNSGTQKLKILHEISQKLLELVYILHKEIYIKLCIVATGVTYRTTKDKQRLTILASDYMLLATAIIAAASYIIDQLTSNQVVLHLSNITQIPEEDILDFTTIIVDKALLNGLTKDTAVPNTGKTVR